ncbi:hypothetical protein HPB50_022030 [Hyalomma asiaticum]|uniref:Uncharacterized protein n=1 Tax=Hyalomma asiaticum TaxID=266040 RepID=A0ACB7T0Y7_HYAAI|nr:hypothetical protein HPB50_022030 [Hyalomma asiaticum]
MGHALEATTEEIQDLVVHKHSLTALQADRAGKTHSVVIAFEGHNQLCTTRFAAAMMAATKAALDRSHYPGAVVAAAAARKQLEDPAGRFEIPGQVYWTARDNRREKRWAEPTGLPSLGLSTPNFRPSPLPDPLTQEPAHSEKNMVEDSGGMRKDVEGPLALLRASSAMQQAPSNREAIDAEESTNNHEMATAVAQISRGKELTAIVINEKLSAIDARFEAFEGQVGMLSIKRQRLATKVAIATIRNRWCQL